MHREIDLNNLIYILRCYNQPQHIAVQNGTKYQNLSDVRNNTDLGAVTEFGSEMLSFFGVSTGNAVASHGFDAMRQALPMIQGLLSVVFVISIPFVMMFSGYSMKAAIVMTFIQFGLYFLTFWWTSLTSINSEDWHNILNTNRYLL